MKLNKTLPTLGGYVTSPNSFIGKSKKIDPYGLFSEQIFGPTESYKCSCGYYSGARLYKNKKCPKCNVFCGNSFNLRTTTFGKIKLVFPIIKSNKKQKFLRFFSSKIRNEKTTIVNPARRNYLISTFRYLCIDPKKKTLHIMQTLNNPGMVNVPLRITGIYSLYLTLRFSVQMLKLDLVEEIFRNNLITKDLLVIPPNLRMVMFDEAKNDMRKPDLHTYYTRLLKFNVDHSQFQINLEKDEEEMMERLMLALRNNEEIIEHSIIEYDIITSKYQHYVDLIYDEVINNLSGKPGLIRRNILGKNIDFSGRAVIKVDPSLPPYRIKVCKKMLKKLWAPYFMYYLSSVKGYYLDYIYDEGIEKDSLDIEFEDFLKWYTDGEYK